MTGWPFSRPLSSHSSGEASSSGRGALAFTQHHMRATSEAVMHQLGAMQHVGKQAYEIAIKRNSLTTSLVLLSGILVADYVMGPTKSRRERMQVLQHNRAPTAPAANQQPQQQPPQQQQQSLGRHHAAPGAA